MPDIEQFGVYKLDINQGNYLTQDLVDRSSRSARRGSRCARCSARRSSPAPSTTTAGTTSTSSRGSGKRVEHRQFTVYFVDDKLARWEGDEMPPSAAQLNRVAADRTLAARALGGRQGLLRTVSRHPAGQLVSLAHRGRRRRRAHGAGADRRRCSPHPTSRSPRRSTSRAAPSSARMPASASGARTGVAVDGRRRRGARRRRRADRLHAARGHARPCRGVRAPPRRAGRRHDRALAGAEGRARYACARRSDRLRAQHERRRQRAAEAGRTRHGAPRSRLRHRDRRDAPPAQGGRAVRHRAAPRRGGGDRDADDARRVARSTPAKA